MTSTFRGTLIALGVMGLATLPSFADGDESLVKGHVVRVEQQVRTENGGEADHLWVRTRQGEEMRLRLGNAGTCPGCVRAGDRIRARVSQGDAPGPARIQDMRVRRQGSMYSYRFRNGELLQSQTRLRSRDGSGSSRQLRGDDATGRGGGRCLGRGGGSSRGSGAGGSGGSRGGGGR